MSTDIYKATLMAHFKAPKNVGALEHSQHQAEGFNASCGDKVQIGFDLVDGRVTNIRYQIRACAICTASTSMMSEALEGLSVEAVTSTIALLHQALKANGAWPEGIEALSGAATSINRHKCIELSWQALGDLLQEIDLPVLQKAQG